MKKHIITDFDGVLGATEDMNAAIVQTLHPDVARERYIIDHHLGNVYETPVVPFTDTTSERYFELYNERLTLDHIRGAIPAILALAEYYNIHIVSSNCEQAIRRVLREGGVEHCFGLILGREAHASKVEKFKHVFSTKHIAAYETLYLTDTLGDINEAKKVTLRTVTVTFGYHPRSVLERGNPDSIVDNWNDVLGAVHTFMAL